MSSAVPQAETTQLTLGSSHRRGVRGLVGALELACVVLASAAALYVIASTILMVADNALALPFSDQWGQLIFTPQQVLSSWLYSQDNEHRILFPRLIFAIDTFLFHESNDFGYFCNIAITFALALLLTAVAARDVTSRSDRVWAGAAVFVLLFSAMQWENFALGYNVGFFLVELAAVASFTLVALGTPTSRKLAGAVGCEAIAVYSLASGIRVGACDLAAPTQNAPRGISCCGVRVGGLIPQRICDAAIPFRPVGLLSVSRRHCRLCHQRDRQSGRGDNPALDAIELFKLDAGLRGDRHCPLHACRRQHAAAR